MKKQINVSLLDDTQLDDTIKKTLDCTFPLPEAVQNAQKKAFLKIRTLAAEKEEKNLEKDADIIAEKLQRKKNFQKIRKVFFRGFAGAGVAAAALFCVYIANPAVSAQIPVTEHIFEGLGDSLEFAGDYTNLAEPVKKSGAEIESITANGTTLTLSEVYCNETALYLSLILHSEEKIPETYLDENGKPVVEIQGLIDFDFDSEGAVNWYEGGDTFIDGAMVDDYTYAGVIRFDMGQYFAYKGTGTNVPENFPLKLSISQIFGTKLVDTRPEMPWELKQKYESAMREHGLGLTDEDYEQFTEEQKDIEHQLFNDMWNAYYEIYPERQQYPNKYDNWMMDGPWEFEFEVARNNKDIIRKDINDIDENGLGIISATRTPVEVTIEMPQNLDYFAVILDANGTLMDSNAAGCQNTASINGYDTSKIYVYICDYIEYMDELKGYWWSPDYEEKAKEKSFQQLLDERSLYHREILFDE